jgi:hypothetical protein
MRGAIKTYPANYQPFPTGPPLFNLEHDGRVALLTDKWELRGKARILAPEEKHLELGILQVN